MSRIEDFDSLNRFSDRVSNYIKYRPYYPDSVISFFKQNLRLTKDHVIADVGSGTGISSLPFLENGNKVIGIEPNKEMREAGEKILSKYVELGQFISIDAVGEETTITDNSVDFVLTGQAFHWLDPVLFKMESKRILKSDSYSVMMWNVRKMSGDPFHEALEKFHIKYGTDYLKVASRWASNQELSKYYGNYEEIEFENAEFNTFEDLYGRYMSSSFAPKNEDPIIAQMKTELRALFEEFAENNKIKLIYNTKLFYGKF